MAAVVLLVIGVAVTLVSAHALWRAVKLALIGQHADGALIDWKRTFREKYLHSGHHVVSRQHFPVVAFQAADGSRHTVVGAVGYDPQPDWPVGRPFPVRYAAGNPDDATIDALSPTWVFPAVFLAAGIVVLISAF
jgi:uncharacterized protein DUF3592